MLKRRMKFTNFSYQTSKYAKRENFDCVARGISDQEFSQLWQCAQFKRISSKDLYLHLKVKGGEGERGVGEWALRVKRFKFPQPEKCMELTLCLIKYCAGGKG